MQKCSRCKEFYSDSITHCKNCGSPLVSCDKNEGMAEKKATVWGSIISVIVAFAAAFLIIGSIGKLMRGLSAGYTELLTDAITTISFGAGLLVVVYGLMTFRKWAPYVLLGIQSTFLLVLVSTCIRIAETFGIDSKVIGFIVVNVALLIANIIYFIKRRDLYNE